MSKPVLDEYWTWVNSLDPAQGSKLSDAIQYSLNQKPFFSVFLDHGEIDISNNLAENAIRASVIGRKNWLFCDTPRGAFSSAAIYSLVETAKANGIDPYRYLLYLLTFLPAHYGSLTQDLLDQLMPWTKSTVSACSMIEIS